MQIEVYVGILALSTSNASFPYNFSFIFPYSLFFNGVKHSKYLLPQRFGSQLFVQLGQQYVHMWRQLLADGLREGLERLQALKPNLLVRREEGLPQGHYQLLNKGSCFRGSAWRS